jgi:hypothetical protein
MTSGLTQLNIEFVRFGIIYYSVCTIFLGKISYKVSCAACHLRPVNSRYRVYSHIDQYHPAH